MDLMIEDLTHYWYFWILAALFFGSIAFCTGASAVYEKKTIVKCFLPTLCAELVIGVLLALNVKHWLEMGASFGWVIYEYGPEVYIAVIAFVCIPIGHLAGMTFVRRKV